MSVKIRLTRHGSKKKPYYRVVVSASKSPRDGKFIEILGHYNPNIDPAGIDFKADRLRHWLTNGATPTTTVKQLIKKSGVLEEKPPEGADLGARGELGRSAVFGEAR